MNGSSHTPTPPSLSLADEDNVKAWLADCLPGQDLALLPAADLLQARDVSGGSGCGVWDCRALVDGVARDYVLKHYRPGFDDYARLGPLGTACKYVRALEELPAFAIRAPRLAGSAFRPGQAAVLTRKIQAEPWDEHTRRQAARTLARLHDVQPGELSDELGDLVRRSTPNRQRILLGVQNFCAQLEQCVPGLAAQARDLLGGQEPRSAMTTLVHGDYFSANLLLARGQLYVIDWDLLALGDPAWDLGFLVGADRGLGPEEVEAVVAAYSQLRPVDALVLDWHRRCWRLFWELRDHVKEQKAASGMLAPH
jgi:hypothetical protein